MFPRDASAQEGPLSMAGFAHASALIGAVFLNGVNIEGVRSQTFEKCRTVRLDEKGDVHLDCPGYQVETPAAPVAPAARAPAPPASAAAGGAPPNRDDALRRPHAGA